MEDLEQERVRGRGRHQEDGELSNRQSENSDRSSFHPFVCSEAVFSSVKTKFNLHPFIHIHFSLPSTLPHPFAKTIFCYSPPFPFFSLFFYVLFFLSTPSVTSATQTQKPTLEAILLASSKGVSVNIV